MSYSRAILKECEAQEYRASPKLFSFILLDCDSSDFIANLLLK